jgi:hypothetical protein
MKTPWMQLSAICVPLALCFSMTRAAETPAANTTAPLPRQDAAGNPIRRAPTGHVSNYDESKVGTYTLPDPLVLQNGQPVRDADTWLKRRRAELIKLYETEIFGRVPERAPKIKFELIETDNRALDGAAVRQRIVGRCGDNPDGPKFNVSLYLPTEANAPMPVLLHVSFFGTTVPSDSGTNAARPGFSETVPLADFLARGYAYATFRYTDVEGDSRTNNLSRLRKIALAPGQTQPADDEWGTITAWAWTASRVLDHLETERAVDAKKVALIGHSRLGKTALWAGALDPRFAMVFASCSGEMGAALARRDYGETVDDMVVNFPWWFAGNFQKYAGRWNDMPVDAHTVIALNAPRPVFITGGTQDQWADPRGQFLAMLAADPVYRLLGKKGLGTIEQPPLDTPVINGELGFLYHTGPHATTPADWKAFLDFADRHLKATH